MLGAISILSSIFGTFFVSTREGGKIMNALYKGVIVSAVISGIAFYFVSKTMATRPCPSGCARWCVSCSSPPP